MSSHGEDDDNDDIEALRKAALATLKPKVQPIAQVISTGAPRKQTPQWSEVPASVDFPGFDDPVPGSDPFPGVQNVAANQPHPRHPSPQVWRGHFMNGMRDPRFKFQGFHTDGRPFPFHPRAHHQSFGDRGRPIFDRGRQMRGGYIANRGSMSVINANRGSPLGHPPGLAPVPQHLNLSQMPQLVPAGGNLIVIQPHKPIGRDGTPQVPQIPVSQNIPDKPDKRMSPPRTAREDPIPQKAKLVLPQDRYHSSQQTSVTSQSQKSESEDQVQKKAKDKFSRYDKSDSEDEDDSSDSHSEVDDIAEEIDRFLKEDDPNILVEDKDIATDDKKETALEEPPANRTEIPDNNSEDEDVASHQSSPTRSEAESLDLDALANGDPVIGDFEDLDFLVDKEPTDDSVSGGVDKRDVHDGASLGGESVNKDRGISPVSSSSSHSFKSQLSLNEDKCNDKDQKDSKNSETRNCLPHQSNSSKEKVSLRNSLSPVSPRNRQDDKRSRSPLPKTHSPFRSRSPKRSHDNYARRMSPRRRSISPRRSPLRYPRSPLRGRSPNRRSISPSKRRPYHSRSPRRAFSPLRQNVSPHRRPLYSRRSASPRGRRKSPNSRSVSPRRNRDYQNDSRDRRNYPYSRRDDPNARYGGSSFFRSLSPSSRSRDRGRRVNSREKARESPRRNERRITDQQHSQSKEISSHSKGGLLGREDPSKGVFMDDKELEKLPPEERVKIEARRKKFGTKEEVRLEDAKKTVSLKSIKERKKKTKKSEKEKEDPLDAPLEESQPKKSDKSGISLKALRKKMEMKKTDQDGEDEEEEIVGPSLNDLDDDSEDSDTGRAWRTEGNQSKPIRLTKPESSFVNNRFDRLDRFQGRTQRRKDQYRPRSCRSPRSRNRARRLPEFRRDVVSDDDNSSAENIPSSRLGSSVVTSSNLKLDIPPEKLRVQIQVSSSKDKKKKKSKSKPDFSQVYSVPAKRRHGSDHVEEEEVEEEVEEEEEEEEVSTPKKMKKKVKKEKKKKNPKETLEEEESVYPTEPVQSRPSILERLGKKVELNVVEKKKKKKKSSKHSDLEKGGKDALDRHIEKMKLRNAAIERRQREIQLDKERYG